MRLAGKTALVTGGSRGIGRACVEALAREGARVAFVYHQNEAAAAALVEQLRGSDHEPLAIQADVRDAAKAAEVVEQLVERWQSLDILVNSAGVIRDGLFALMTAEHWRDVVETNLFGTFNYCHAATRPMMSQRRGS
ncbi:MAG TPA: SDR family NAD(P)-dependent oxidoreductase, partial [Pirellulales bacterium]